MEIKPQASFIPKKPIIESRFSQGSSFSVVTLIAGIILGIASASAIALFGYNYYLNEEIKKMDIKLEQARKDLKPALIDELSRIDLRIKSAETILDRHIKVSAIFKALEALTVNSIWFESMSFGESKDDSVSVTLKGVAQTFNAVAFQSDVFRKEKNFKNPIFSGLQVDEDDNIQFDVAMGVDMDLVLYKNYFSGGDNNSETEESLENNDVPASSSPIDQSSGSAI